MTRFTAATFLALVAIASAQKVGTSQAEVHPGMTSQTCTAKNVCTTQSTSVVLDSNWRWLHNVGGYTNCYTGNTWNTALCPDPVTCAANCALEGANYASTYGITTSGNALTLKFVTGSNVGSRVYLMESDTKYKLFKPLNQEFTFDVDVSNLPCGLNGALYFSAMDADGGMAAHPTNQAGAKYGTGYCDAQCPHDMKFINGEANILDWTPSSNDANAGGGRYGACCDEMDIWEANKISSAYTPHPCSSTGLSRCEGTACGDGDNRYQSICDKDGCDFNSYRMGNTAFYGEGKTVDTTKKITVVTQFITDTGTATGTLTEIKRFYVQNSVVIPNSQSTVTSAPGNSITNAFCANQKNAFGDQNLFATRGGLAKMGTALKNGMVLSMSIWDDHAANMLWLDSTYPPTKPVTGPGVARGTCPATSGVAAEVEAQYPNSSVTFSNIKVGPLNTTY